MIYIKLYNLLHSETVGGDFWLGTSRAFGDQIGVGGIGRWIRAALASCGVAITQPNIVATVHVAEVLDGQSITRVWKDVMVKLNWLRKLKLHQTSQRTYHRSAAV